MIQEYLFVGEEHKKEISEYSYKTVAVEMQDIEASECWIVQFSMDGENGHSARTLSKVHQYVMEHFAPTVLSNGCSAYFNKVLYPHFNEFERKLRKLLYLKIALSAEKKDFETIKDLESKDLGEIFTLLFSDAKFVTNVRSTVNNKSWQFTKDEILSDLQGIPENTIWDKLLGNNTVPLLRTHFVKVKDYRNEVMHAHNMDSLSFFDAIRLIKKINEQLDGEIGKIIVEKEAKTASQEGSRFNTALSDAMKRMDQAKQSSTIEEQFAEIQAEAAKMQKFANAVAQYQKYVSAEMSELRESLEAFKQDPDTAF